MKKVWIKDLDRCIGCETCVIACKQENQLIPGIQYRRLLTINQEQYPEVPTVRISISCNHCERPACLKNCPVQAYRKEDGRVIHDQEKCVGCKLCLWSCPYDAPRFSKVKGRVEKCNLCQKRTERGLEPACVTACPTGAIQLVENLADWIEVQQETKQKVATTEKGVGGVASGSTGQAGSIGLMDTIPGLPSNQTQAKFRMKSKRRIGREGGQK